MHIIFSEHFDPAMRYEGLARFAFDNCLKYKDPWGYCAQERYSQFTPEPTLEGKRMLATIFIKLILNNQNSQYSEKLKDLENKIWESTTKDAIVEIIDATIIMFTKKK